MGVADTCAVVLGMHRSGTSATAALLSRAGLALPLDLMPPRPFNPLGFQESLGVVRLNDAVLEALGSAWDRVGPWYAPDRNPAASRNLLAEWLVRHFAAKASEALDHAFPRGAGIVLKDPRICLLLPLWRAAIQGTGRTPRFFIAARHPLAVAASLRRRNAMAPREAFWLWHSYMLGALAADPEASVVHYDEVIERPEAVLARLCATLGVRLPRDAQAGVREAVPVELRHHEPADADATERAVLPAQVGALWDLLASWERRSPGERAAAIQDLQARYDDAALLTLKGRVVPALSTPDAPWAAPRQEAPPEPDPTTQAQPMRRFVVIHYHLFQNGGALLQQLLRHNFGAACAEQEFPFSPERSNSGEVAAYLAAHPDVQALSSHTAVLPLPALPGMEVFPIFFLRHPLLRLRSAYLFERRQTADTLGARLAKRTDLAGYISELLVTKASRQARNFQSFRLSFGAPGSGSEERRAERTLASLPFVGLTEASEASLARLEALLRPRLPGFQTAIGAMGAAESETPAALEAQVAELRRELGQPLFERLVEANAADLRLHAKVAEAYGVGQL
jgi:hypothetical protein